MIMMKRMTKALVKLTTKMTMIKLNMTRMRTTMKKIISLPISLMMQYRQHATSLMIQ
jgi:hypothetical protein